MCGTIHDASCIMRAFYRFSIYKRGTEMEAVIGVTSGSETNSDGVLIVNNDTCDKLRRINVKQWKP